MRFDVDIGWKGFSVSRRPGQELTSVASLMPRTLFDYKSEVDGYQSAIIMACVRWLQRTYPEAPVMLEKQESDGAWERINDHPLLMLLDMPNPFYDGLQLTMGIIADYVLSGNAYILKRRSEAGRVVEYWWTPSTLIEPKWPIDGSVFLSHYEYRAGSQGYKDVAVEDVIHLRDGFDPNNLRKGLSPLRSLFREVFTDDEAANMTASLMKNLGVPGLVLSPEGDTSISPDEAERIKAWLDEKYTGDNRGQPLVMSAASKTSTFGFNPEQMQMRELRKIPEERITAVIGVPAIVAGLGAGLDRSTYANYKEAREAAYEGTILPMQRLIGSTLKRQGLSEYEDDLLHWNVRYDLSGVRILQEDENKRVERINNMVTGGYVKVRDAQEMTGVPIDDTQDYYLRPFNVVPVESGPAPVSIASNSKELKFSMDEMGKEQHWRMYVLKAENHENRLIDGLQGMFADQQREALQNFNQTYRAVIDAGQAKQDYREIATPVLSSLMASEIEDARNMLNGHKALKQESVLTQAALTWLKTRIGWAAEEVGEQTAELLSLQMAEGYALGEGIPELTKRVKGVFEFSSDTRARRIARTETIQAAAQGSIEGYKAEGVGRLEFYAALDERICPDCLALHETEFPINESTGIITVHPNCRCVWLPVI